MTSAAEIVVGLSKLPARKLDATARPCVISVAYFNAGDEKTVNRLPNQAVLRGTIRAYEDIGSASKGPAIKTLIDSYLNGMGTTLNVTPTVEYKPGAPTLANNGELYKVSRTFLQSAWPSLRMQAEDRAMTADDFAFYTDKYPCLYIGLGIAKGGLGEVGVHQDTFTLHPDAIATGIKLCSLLALAPAGAEEAPVGD